MTINMDLLEAVNRLRQAEKDVIESRRQVADLLCKAASTQPVTGLSMMTGIGRTTIYWLMKTWSSNNEDRNTRNQSY